MSTPESYQVLLVDEDPALVSDLGRKRLRSGARRSSLAPGLGVAIASHAAELPDALTHRADTAQYRARLAAVLPASSDVAA
jgi:hypothetical protein